MMMRTLMALVMVMGLGACATMPDYAKAKPDDPDFAPVIPDMPREEIIPNGSLFHADVANSLYSDVKARRVGDIISIILSESTTANKSATTTTSKSSSASVDPITGLGGNNVNIGGQSIQLGVGSANDFSGAASTDQSNNLSGAISVTVIQVLANRNLVIRGEKWMTLNNGDEYVRLTGIIRPEDISPDNEIESTKVANARIQYSGTGTFAEVQQQGWLTKFFSSAWWPF